MHGQQISNELTDLFELAGGYGGMKNNNLALGSDGESHVGPSGDMH
jgi:hypothetical protein